MRLDELDQVGHKQHKKLKQLHGLGIKKMKNNDTKLF